MHKSLLVGPLFVLAPTLIAQPQTFPVGYDTKDGGSYSYYIGGWADSHVQIMTGGMQGSNQTQVWRFLRLRRSQNTTTNEGRSWTNVQLAVGDHNYKLVSDNYKINMLTTTTVFSNSVTWPGHTGAPPSNPAPWGKFVNTDDVAFPFSQPYTHTGKWGTYFDFRFFGGTLANQAAWATTLIPYYHDGIANNNQSTGGSYTLTSAGSCLAAYFVVWLFSDKLANNQAGHRAQPFMYSGLASTPHMGLIGVDNGLNPGVPFPGSCHALYLDLTKPSVPFPFTTDAQGQFFSPFLFAPWVAAIAGKTLWSQAAFISNGNLELTRAGSAPIAALPTATPVAFMKRIYKYGPTAQTEVLGFGPYDTLLPILHLDVK